MFALKSMQLRGTQLGGWDLSCQIPRKSTAVPNRASSEEMMIFGTGENVSASTASLEVIGQPWLEIHLIWAMADGCV
jgi:hypothetical protein